MNKSPFLNVVLACDVLPLLVVKYAQTSNHAIDF